MKDQQHQRVIPWRPYLAAIRELAGWRIALVLLLIVIGGLIEGFGLLLLIPLLQVAGIDVQQGSVGQLAQTVARVFQAAHVPLTLPFALLVYVGVTTTQAFLHEAQTSSNALVEQAVARQLRTRLYRAIINANWLFLSRLRNSDLSHALTVETDRVADATQQLFALLAGGLVALVYIGLAFRVSAPMTTAICACGALLLAALAGRARAAHETGEDYSRTSESLYAAAQEHLAGAKVAKSYGAERRFTAVFDDLADRMSHVHVRIMRHYARSQALFNIGSVCILSILVLVAVEVLSLPTASLLLLLFLFARVIPRLSGLYHSAHLLMNTLPSFQTVQELEARCLAAAEAPARTTERLTFTRVIRCEALSFRYDDSGRFALEDINLEIEAGRTTALAGPSGSGKSTLGDLVLGLLTPTSGTLLIDGRPLGPNDLARWRAQVGYVAQDTFLFHDTVRANLLWARPGASDKDVNRALALAAADAFVGGLPQGLDTVVGERGISLSGGERQRLALARALLREPSLLVLDEPTSALDSENERRIWQAINELNRRLTILVITHQLASVRGADAIYVVDAGRIVESGTWRTLMADDSGRFRRLWRAQSELGDLSKVIRIVR